MNKKALVKKIVARLTAELDLYVRAARAAHAEATHEQSKAENKYDTRGLEASYLARGQSRQANEIEQAIEQLESMNLRDFAPDEPVDLGALVELDMEGESSLYFVAARAGGTEVLVSKQEVLVITPQSPLGEQIIGKKQGDRVDLAIAGGKRHYKILSVV